MKNRCEKMSKKLNGLENKSFDSLLYFIDKKQWVFSCPEFWHSPIVETHFDKLISHPNFPEFLLGYFRNDNTCHPDFLKKIAEQKMPVLIRIVKLSKIHLKPNHWKSLEILKRNKDFKPIYLGLEFVHELLADWERQLDFHLDILLEYSFEDLLIHFVSYFERFKRYSRSNLNNRNHTVEVEMNMCYLLNKILNNKKEKNTSTDEKQPLETFLKNINDILPPKNTSLDLGNPNDLPEETITEVKRRIRKSIDFLFAYHQDLQHQLAIYYTGLADFGLIDKQDLNADLETNKLFDIRILNDRKSPYQERYFRKDADTAELGDYKKQIAHEVSTELAYWNWLCLPSEIKDGGEGIRVEDLLLVLKTFSRLVIPEGRILFPSQENSSKMKVFTRKKPKDFERLFGNNYIHAWKEKDLVASISEYFGWEDIKSGDIVCFFTTDLNSKRKFPIDFINRPFVKSGDKIIWLSSFMRDRRHAVALHKRVHKKTHQQQSPLLEEKTGKMFSDAGFGAISSYKIEHGEIDCLAYKDNTLFVVELKTTYLDEEVIKNQKYGLERLELKASSQLTKVVDYLRSNLEETFSKLNQPIPKGEIKIFPLIVSNIFEHDYLMFNQKFPKISLFELEIILTNNLYKMLKYENQKDDFTRRMMAQMNANDISTNQQQSEKSIREAECDLWSGKKECSADDLIELIEQNKIWEHVENKTNLVQHEIPLTTYKENKKWLH
jgi:Holliday junction resolvase-like predicted endonuclease